MHLNITLDCDATFSAALERRATPFALASQAGCPVQPLPLATFMAHLVAMHAAATTRRHTGAPSSAYLPPVRPRVRLLNHFA
jgi:hypothetical protein